MYSKPIFSASFDRYLLGRRFSRRKKIRILTTLVTLGFAFFIFFVFLTLAAFIIYAKDLPSPDKLSSHNEEISTRILDRNGSQLYTVHGDKNRTLITLDQVPKSLKDATVAIEDKTFYTHRGFDWRGIARSVKNLVMYREVTGGSTITQQAIKNTLLSAEKTLPRKIKELILAIEVERRYSKDQILQIYLNEVPYGGTAWGIEAAANMYFGKSVKDLNLIESATLAGFPQRPSVYSPYGTDPKAYIDRTKDVLRRMREDGYINKEEEEKALTELPNVKFQPLGSDIKAGHFVMYLRNILVEKYGEKMVQEGGLQVTTTLDLKIQEEAQKAISEQVAKEGKSLGYSNGAAVVQDAKTGQILAMVGSRNYLETEGFDGNVNVATSLRQPGSSIKPINYVTGFKKGFSPATMILDVPVEFPGQPPYKPVNYDGGFHGPQQVRYALGNSYNIPAVKMLSWVGVKEMIQTAKDLGINTFSDPNRYGLSLTLGGGEVKLVELVNAYSAFANGGLRVDPVAILKVTDPNGKVLEEFKPGQARQALTAEHAFMIADILSDKNAKLSAFGSYSVENILSVKGKTIAAKTGTTDDKKDNWTVGFTPSVTIGTWVGNNDNKQMNPKLASGITGAAPIWHRIAAFVLKDKPNEPFVKPKGVVQMEIDKLSGLKPGPYSEKRLEYFASWQVPTREDDMHKVVRICTPSGKLASSACEAAGLAKDQVFLVLYDQTVKSSCDPCPPTETDTNYYNPQGTQNPVVTILKPKDKDEVPYEFDVEADIATPYTVVKIEFYLDDTLLYTITSSPYKVTFKLSAAASGKRKILVKGYDSAGNSGKAEIEVTVKSPT